MSAPRNRASGQVRIIGGQWRGRKLPVLNAQGLRPTTDRTKETLFNWLMHDLRGATCLDAFAGSGSLGFEALSRGAQRAIFFEKDKLAANAIKKNINMLSANAKTYVGDSLSLLSQLNSAVQIVFIDPPYGMGLVAPFLHKLIEHECLEDDAIIYIEHEANLSLQLHSEIKCVKEKATSQFKYGLYRFKP